MFWGSKWSPQWWGSLVLLGHSNSPPLSQSLTYISSLSSSQLLHLPLPPGPTSLSQNRAPGPSALYLCPCHAGCGIVLGPYSTMDPSFLGQKTSRSSHDTCFLCYLHPLKSLPMNEGEFPFLMRFQWGGIFQTLTISGIFFGGVKNLLRFKRLLSSLSTTLVLAETESWVMPMPWEWKQVSQQLKKWVAQWKERGTCICQLLDN